MSAAAAIKFATSDKHVSDKIVVNFGLGSYFNLSIATYRIFCMLCGMSLELGYKAILVAEAKEPPATHDLVKLAEAAGLKPGEEDKELLNIWTQLIIWDGKYPVPKKDNQMYEYAELLDSALWDRTVDSPLKRMNDRIDWSGFKVF